MMQLPCKKTLSSILNAVAISAFNCALYNLSVILDCQSNVRNVYGKNLDEGLLSPCIINKFVSLSLSGTIQ